MTVHISFEYQAMENVMENIHKYHKMTIRHSVSFVGIGLHTGKVSKLTLYPSVDSRGIYFIRSDVKTGNNTIDANWRSVSNTILSTNLSNQTGVSVYTVEHLMSALIACGIDNVRIEIDGPEVPILDGSSEGFVEAIKSVGVKYLRQSKQGIWVTKPVAVTDGDKYALLLPHSVPRVTVCIDYPDTIVGSQCYSASLEGNDYFHNIAYARTFGFADQLDELKKQGLVKGGALINAVLVDGDEIVNPEGLRVKNEFVRHKVLDAFGDLALAGTPIIGHYYAYKAGHGINLKLMNKLFRETSSWTCMSLREGKNIFADIDENHSDEYIKQTINSIKKASCL